MSLNDMLNRARNNQSFYTLNTYLNECKEALLEKFEENDAEDLFKKLRDLLEANHGQEEGITFEELRKLDDVDARKFWLANTINGRPSYKIDPGVVLKVLDQAEKSGQDVPSYPLDAYLLASLNGAYPMCVERAREPIEGVPEGEEAEAVADMIPKVLNPWMAKCSEDRVFDNPLEGMAVTGFRESAIAEDNRAMAQMVGGKLSESLKDVLSAGSKKEMYKRAASLYKELKPGE